MSRMNKKEEKNVKIYNWVFNQDRFRNDIEELTDTTITRDLETKLAFKKSDFKDKTVLDAGCGYGRIADAIAGLGAKKVVGIDITPSNIERAKRMSKNKNTEFKVRNILDRVDKKYDIVICTQVLMHTRDPEEAFRNLARMTKDGGTIALWVYEYQNIVKRSITDFIKFFTLRMNERVLYHLCKPPAWLARRMFIGKVLMALVRIDTDSMGNFDTFAVPYMAEFKIKEMEKFFHDNNIRILKITSETENTGFKKMINGRYGGGFGMIGIKESEK